MRKLEQDLAAERALRQMGNPRGTGVPFGTTVPGQGTSAPPAAPGRSARDMSAIIQLVRKGCPSHNISWASKRQTSVAMSSCEADYMAACMASKEAVGQRSFLEELGEPRT